jgi:sortase (surface protein transpeptidase)
MFSIRSFMSNRKNLYFAVAAFLAAFGVLLIVFSLLNQKTPPKKVSINSNSVIAPDITSSSAKNSDSDNITALGYSKPTRLIIPSLKTDADIIELGKEESGIIEVPSGKQVDQPGWYKHSPAPGQAGAAIILGHVDNFKGPSLFWELESLKKSDVVKVKRQDGSAVVFEVLKIEQYPKNNFPTSKVYVSESNGAELRLITCGGYNEQSRDYEYNTVVFARRVDD